MFFEFLLAFRFSTNQKKNSALAQAPKKCFNPLCTSRLNLYDDIEEFTVKLFSVQFLSGFLAGKPWISAVTCKKQKCSILFRTHFTNN